MGQRSHTRKSVSTNSGRLPFSNVRVAPVLAGLSLLLVTGCDRAALEGAFAPDPQLVEESATQADGSATASNSAGNSAGNPAKSTAPGGSATVNSSKTTTSNKNKPNDKTNGSTNKDKQQKSAVDNSSTVANDSSDSNSDIANIPAELERSVANVLALGVLEPTENADEWTFEPNQPVTRGEFARWLLAVNNAVYGDRPAAQIRTARPDSTAAFKDVPTTHPEFASIQGLAEAGIILSSLSGAQEQINFRPDEPLSREDMLLWKVPLDVREALPSSNIEAVKEAWGFQDASKINGPALRAVLADYGNGDQAVIRRVFGYTTLLQPQKSVTQSEAAAALGYFGNGGLGISVGDL